jgi:radical SAM protein (TIGR01212 family)
MYSWGTKRKFNAATDYLRRRFGTRIQKLTLDAGFTCPNRDGTISTGGCAYCNNNAFNPSYCNPEKPIAQQINEGIEFHEKRYRSAEKYLAYFQAYSNTYAPLETLKDLYQQALANEKIIGLVIGTRPDCIDEYKLEYLAGLSEKYYVVVEYGVESVNNESLRSINRGHTYEDAIHAIALTTKFGVNAGAHLIFGIPGESRQEMMQSAAIISTLPLHTVKFHQLQIVKDTHFAMEYKENPAKFELFKTDEYVDFISQYLALLNPDFIIERLASETQPRNNLAEDSGLRYDQVLQRIEKRMKELDLWQGKNYEKC